MNEPLCNQLDDYLDRSLAGAERAAFEVHLQDCAHCREAVEELDQLHGLLTRATRELQPVPRTLIDRIEQRLQAARRRRLVLRLAAMAAAALLAVGIAVRLSIPKPSQPEASRPLVAEQQPGPPPTKAVDPRSRVRVTFSPRSSVIDVPIQTASPDVTLIWLYPVESSEPGG